MFPSKSSCNKQHAVIYFFLWGKKLNANEIGDVCFTRPAIHVCCKRPGQHVVCDDRCHDCHSWCFRMVWLACVNFRHFSAHWYFTRFGAQNHPQSSQDICSLAFCLSLVCYHRKLIEKTIHNRLCSTNRTRHHDDVIASATLTVCYHM